MIGTTSLTGRVRPLLLMAATISTLSWASGDASATLTLEQALTSTEHASHPDLVYSRSQLLSAEAKAQRADADYALEAALELEARWIDPSDTAFDSSSQDHRASLTMSKRLYDFGVTSSVERSVRSLIDASMLDVRFAEARHLIEIARRYFDVVLADMKYSWSNERMAMDYVTYDKVRDRYELKQLDEIDMLEEEASYQRSLVTRTEAAFEQRVSRALLADALGKPDDLPAEVVTPVFADIQAEIAEPDELYHMASDVAPTIRSQRLRVTSAQQAFDAADNAWQPSLDAELALTEYHRQLPSNENWRAELNLRVPLFENGKHRAGLYEAHAKLLKERAKLEQERMTLRGDVYRLWQSINTLITRSKALAVELEYASKALDRSRGEYELERRTDFGDAQVRTSRVRLDKATSDFALAIEKMRLAVLIGKDPVEVVIGKVR